MQMKTAVVLAGGPGDRLRLTQLVAKLTGFERKIMFGSYPPGYPQRPAQWDPDYLALDNAKIRKYLGWMPTATLQEGLLKTIKSWKKEPFDD